MSITKKILRSGEKVSFRFCYPKLAVQLCLSAPIALACVTPTFAIQFHDLLSDDPLSVVESVDVHRDISGEEWDSPASIPTDADIPVLELGGEILSIEPSSVTSPAPSASALTLSDQTRVSGYDSEDANAIILAGAGQQVNPSASVQFNDQGQYLLYFKGNYVIPATSYTPEYSLPWVYYGTPTRGTDVLGNSSNYNNYCRYNFSFAPVGLDGKDFTASGIYCSGATVTWTWPVNVDSQTIEIDALIGGYMGVRTSPPLASSTAPQYWEPSSVSILVNGQTVVSNAKRIASDGIIFNSPEPITSIQLVQYFPSKTLSSSLDGASSATIKSYINSQHDFSNLVYFGTGYHSTFGYTNQYLRVTPIASGALSGVNDNTQNTMNEAFSYENAYGGDFASSTGVLQSPTITSSLGNHMTWYKDQIETIWTDVLPVNIRVLVTTSLVLGCVALLIRVRKVGK